MILCREDPFCKLFVEMGEPVYVMEENPTAENLAKLIFHHAQSQGLPVTAVELWENESSSAEYRV
jgi:6-pyruvoyltetrahydropterin/6-carboxytetrahydropterin synthase